MGREFSVGTLTRLAFTLLLLGGIKHVWRRRRCFRLPALPARTGFCVALVRLENENENITESFAIRQFKKKITDLEKGKKKEKKRGLSVVKRTLSLKIMLVLVFQVLSINAISPIPKILIVLFFLHP
jgi:hypothetical protein